MCSIVVQKVLVDFVGEQEQIMLERNGCYDF